MRTIDFCHLTQKTCWLLQLNSNSKHLHFYWIWAHEKSHSNLLPVQYCMKYSCCPLQFIDKGNRLETTTTTTKNLPISKSPVSIWVNTAICLFDGFDVVFSCVHTDFISISMKYRLKLLYTINILIKWGSEQTPNYAVSIYNEIWFNFNEWAMKPIYSLRHERAQKSLFSYSSKIERLPSMPQFNWESFDILYSDFISFAPILQDYIEFSDKLIRKKLV